jgi:thiol-disulfide isomerase/thioredoxin
MQHLTRKLRFTNMKKSFILALVILCQATSYSQEVKSMKVDELQQFIQSRTRPTVINFWATWCGPCVQEMPWFNKIVNQNKNVDLVFVSLDDNRAYPDKIQSFIDARNINGTLIWLNEPTPDISAIVPRWSRMIPTTIFINNKSGYKKFKEQQVSQTELRKQLRLLTRE